MVKNERKKKQKTNNKWTSCTLNMGKGGQFYNLHKESSWWTAHPIAKRRVNFTLR